MELAASPARRMAGTRWQGSGMGCGRWGERCGGLPLLGLCFWGRPLSQPLGRTEQEEKGVDLIQVYFFTFNSMGKDVTLTLL